MHTIVERISSRYSRASGIVKCQEGRARWLALWAWLNTSFLKWKITNFFARQGRLPFTTDEFLFVCGLFSPDFFTQKPPEMCVLPHSQPILTLAQISLLYYVLLAQFSIFYCWKYRMKMWILNKLWMQADKPLWKQIYCSPFLDWQVASSMPSSYRTQRKITFCIWGILCSNGRSIALCHWTSAYIRPKTWLCKSNEKLCQGQSRSTCTSMWSVATAHLRCFGKRL